MKLAILLGISEYRTAGNLPACKSDVFLIERLIKATGLYSDVLCISDNSTAASTKERITTFIKSHQTDQTDELFLYYTGHGDFFDNEFYYVLSDFDVNHRKQTSLENTEVDEWIRSLKPKLAVKVIDACHSGITYVKDEQSLEGYLQKSIGKLNNCYFMFSSKLNQASYQDSELSFFTKSFVKAIVQHKTDEIRYKDITDAISDEFRINPSQTPYFVSQAQLTEVFSAINPEMRQLGAEVDKPSTETDANTLDTNPQNQPLVALIQAEAQKYRTEEETNAILKKLGEKIERHSYSDEFTSIYDVHYSFEKHSTLADIEQATIGKWLEKNGRNFFGHPTYQKIEIEKPILDPWSLYTQKMYRPRYETRVEGFELTSEAPYDIINIKLQSRYPNIPWAQGTLVLILSKTSIQLFYFYIDLIENNWRKRELPNSVNWRTLELSLSDEEAIFRLADRLQSELQDFLLKRLKERFIPSA